MTRSPQFIGAACASASVIFFSINDVLIKFLSGGYALHQVVLLRSLIGLLVIAVLILPFSGGLTALRTKRLGMHIFRGLCVVTANMTFFLGLAAMELATAVAIFFVSPLVITVFSVVFLGETVGPRRWIAIVVGFVGVLIILRPGTDAFQFASLLPLIAAVAYAGIHMITRKIGGTESAATMAVYIQLVFITVCAVIGLAVGDGRFGDQSDPSLQFLLRAWSWPDAGDYWVFALLGFGVGIAGFLISQAYRVAEAAFVAPFEYLAMPLAILWGYVVFSEVPDRLTFVGAGLIIGGGLFTLWREARVADVAAAPRTRR
ncbi:DMT family transporter [Yoonia sp. R2331]|uniref:DMT family transporter n=1 Tax=Yoonia sp. R2331 TaxID=3237238 RepID=UPI0034E40A19